MKRDSRKFWFTLLPFKIGQRVRIVSIHPCEKSTFVTQAGFHLNLVGVEGHVIMLGNFFIPESHCYLVQLHDKTYTLDSSNQNRDRIWCAPEELEAIE